MVTSARSRSTVSSHPEGTARLGLSLVHHGRAYSDALIFRSKTGVPVMRVTRTTLDSQGRAVELLYVTAPADRNVFVYGDLPLS